MAELAAAASGAGDQGDERRAKVRRIRRLLDEAERPALRRARPYEPSADPLEQLRRVALLEGVPDDSEDDAEPADAEARVRSSLRGRVWKVLLGDGDEIDPARYAQLTEAAAEEARREAAASERGGASPGVSHAAARDTETRAAEDARADETSIAHDATRTFRTDTDFWRHPSQREAQLRRVLSTYAFVARGRRRPAHGEACDISSTGVDGAASGGGDRDGHDDDASDRSGRCYVQGMNAVCGPLIYVMPEADAFSALGTLLSKMCPRYFESNLAGERARGAAREPSPPPPPPFPPANILDFARSVGPKGVHLGCLLVERTLEVVDLPLAQHLAQCTKEQVRAVPAQKAVPAPLVPIGLPTSRAARAGARHGRGRSTQGSRTDRGRGLRRSPTVADGRPRDEGRRFRGAVRIPTPPIPLHVLPTVARRDEALGRSFRLWRPSRCASHAHTPRPLAREVARS